MSCVQGVFRQDFTCRTIRSKNDNFHYISFLVLYLHNQVMLFPMSRDSFIMTTTFGHHKERGLRGPFWDSFPIEFCPCDPSYSFTANSATPDSTSCSMWLFTCLTISSGTYSAPRATNLSICSCNGMSVGIVFVKTFAKEPDGMFVAIFPLSFSRSGDVIVMTTICDHHRERGLNDHFWDNFLARGLANSLPHNNNCEPRSGSQSMKQTQTFTAKIDSLASLLY